MKYNSSVFSEILQVVDSPEPDMDTGRPEMPAVLQPVFTPGGVTRAEQAGTRGESHFSGATVTVAAGAQTITTLTTLREGVWRLKGTFYFISSVVAAPLITEFRLVQGATVIGRLAAAFPHTTVTSNVMCPVDVQVTLDTDTAISISVQANAAGERTVASVQLHAQRIA